MRGVRPFPVRAELAAFPAASELAAGPRSAGRAQERDGRARFSSLGDGLAHHPLGPESQEDPAVAELSSGSAVPRWARVRHEADDGAVPFSYSERPIREKLGMWREDRGDA